MRETLVASGMNAQKDPCICIWIQICLTETTLFPFELSHQSFQLLQLLVLLVISVLVISVLVITVLDMGWTCFSSCHWFWIAATSGITDNGLDTRTDSLSASFLPPSHHWTHFHFLFLLLIQSGHFLDHFDDGNVNGNGDVRSMLVSWVLWLRSWLVSISPSGSTVVVTEFKSTQFDAPWYNWYFDQVVQWPENGGK